MMRVLFGSSSQSNVFRRPSRSPAPRRPPGRSACLALALAVSLGAPAVAAAQAAGAEATKQSSSSYVPQVGQQGKDVVWVPTPQVLVDKMLELAKVTPADHLIDLGSGDGRTVITAARRGIRAHGIEYNPEMVELARRNAAAAGVSERATFVRADLFETDLSQASVITLFLLPTINEKLRPRLLELKPGTRIVSNTFPMGDWKPDEQATLTTDCQGWCTALLWIVPAKVAGSWNMDGQALKLTQTYQQVEGTLGADPISDVRLRGDEIAFTAKGVRYQGKVNGNTMQGTRTGSAQAAWTAVRS
ncbi:MAG: class I SAM-dependent methyltransferase [Pigmentiphaga sp.]|uniref:SAM-dependent methyltransferase n=1 Tax=Pigmentiphaga sp. TaxID=1977564 RepID=UPI0029B6F93A|nr:class I SAM-dependent methyltransferase [Pigmentiphaga sp.]MDX3906581.1 class I SAM-dependent methyltransferase [Pigmentiphaga sp.]